MVQQANEDVEAPRDSPEERSISVSEVAFSPEDARGTATDQPNVPEGAVKLKSITAMVTLEREPAAGAVVEAWENECMGPPHYSASTDEGGRFVLEEVSPQASELVIAVHVGQAARRVVTYVLGKQAPDEDGLVDLGRIQLLAASISRVRVLDVDGAPGVPAELFLLEGSAGRSRGRPTVVELVADYGGDVHDLRTGVTPYTTDSCVVGMTESGVGWANLSSLERDGLVQFELRPLLPVELQVVDENGVAIPGATLRVLPNFYPLGALGQRCSVVGRADGLVALFSATGDSEGRIATRLPQPPSLTDTYTFVVMREGYLQSLRRVRGSDVLEGETVVLGSARHITLSGSIYGPDRRSVAGATVTFGGESLLSDADGRFKFSGNLQKARGLLSVRAEGFAALMREVEITDIGRSEMDLELERGAVLEGRVTDEEGGPLRASLVLRDATRSGVRAVIDTTTSSSNGRFRFEGVPQGELWLSVEPLGQGNFRRCRDLQVVGGETEAHVVLEKVDCPGRLSATVHDPQGLSASVEAAAITRHGSSVALARSPDITITGNSLLASSLPRGMWRLWVIGRGGLSGYHDFEILDEVLDVHADVTLAPKVTVTGMLMLPGQYTLLEPLPDVRFSPDLLYEVPEGQAWQEHLPVASRTVRASPDLTFSAELPSADYKVTATGPGLRGNSALLNGVENVELFIELKPGNTARLVFLPHEGDREYSVHYKNTGNAMPVQGQLSCSVPSREECALLIAVAPGPGLLTVYQQPSAAEVASFPLSVDSGDTIECIVR